MDKKCMYNNIESYANIIQISKYILLNDQQIPFYNILDDHNSIWINNLHISFYCILKDYYRFLLNDYPNTILLHFI